MGRKVIAIWLSLIMMVSFVVIIDVTMDFMRNAGGTTLYVNTTGSGGAYTKIQDAINDSIDGDTVFVYNGTYYENVVVNKTINLTGENKNTTIIDGGGSGDVVYVSADWVNITEFTLTNSGSSGVAGLHAVSDYITLSHNDISSNNAFGIYLDSSLNNIITGNDVSNNRNGIRLESSSNNEIKICNVSNNSAYGIEFSQSLKNNIVNCLISNNEWVGIRLKQSSENNITSCTFLGNNDGGIYAAESSINNTISDCNVFQNDNSGIDIRSSNNKITNCNVSYNTGYGFRILTTSGTNITNCNVSNNEYGIYLWRAPNSILRNNKMDHNTYNFGVKGYYIDEFRLDIDTSNTINDKILYFLVGINDLEISPTTGYSDAGYIGIIDSNNITVNDFTFENNYQGILFYSTKNSSIQNINVSNNLNGIQVQYRHFQSNVPLNNSIINCYASNNKYGIMLFESSNNSVSKCNASYNTMDGIYLQESSNNNITLNNLANNSNEGIGLYMHSDNNIMFRNNISRNNIGIYLTLSDENSIKENNVENNFYGIRIVDTLTINNRVYHNNILYNTNQATDSTDMGNQWDDGYPSGGNFWSDYTGPDKFRGPNQDIPGNDGIGDNNYSIDSNSIDKYPLISPTGHYIFLYLGWNLISLPFIQSETNLRTVLSSIIGAYDAVQWFNMSDSNDPWKHNSTKKPYHLNDLDSIDHIMGFWIHITEPGGILFKYYGTQPIVNQTITLDPGWNLVGYPSITNHNRTDGLNNLTFDTHVDSIWTYNAATQKWKELTASDYFEVGKGYYIHAKEECTWEIPL